MSYSEKKKKEFVKRHLNSPENTARKETARKIFDEKIPSRQSLKNWMDKYREKLDEKDQGENMKNKSGPEVLENVVQSSEVDKAGGSSAKEIKTENKENKNNESTNSGGALDLSKARQFISNHKKEVGLAVAGLTAVVLFLSFKPTINVANLDGHGEPNGVDSDNSSGNDEDDENEDLPDDAWRG